MTITRPDLVPNHWKDVVCPPNPDATCVCGYPLAEPRGDVPDLGSECPDQDDTFTPVGGVTLDCPHAVTCDVCDTELCTEHSDEFTSVGPSGHTHHRACAIACSDCRETLRQIDGWF